MNVYGKTKTHSFSWWRGSRDQNQWIGRKAFSAWN